MKLVVPLRIVIAAVLVSSCSDFDMDTLSNRQCPVGEKACVMVSKESPSQRQWQCVSKTNPNTGCATDKGDGQCVPCGYSNAATACNPDGTCGISECNAGFANCNNLRDDGCEVDIKFDKNNCGACGTRCSTVHGIPGCASGVCLTYCEAGWDDCNKNETTSNDGCETDLNNSPEHCGTCRHQCASGKQCIGGKCSP